MEHFFIKTERLTITEFDESMVQSVHENSLDDDNRRFVPDEVFETVEIARETMQFLMECYKGDTGPYVYPVVLRSGDNIGYVQAVPLSENEWEIGYHIAGKYTGNGYAAEAVAAFLPVIMKRLGISKIEGHCLLENIASQRVMEKCGFELEYSGIGSYQGAQREVCRYVFVLREVTEPPESLETPRLHIRRFVPDDWQDLHEYLSQEDVVRFEPYGVFTIDGSKQEAARRAGDDSFWAVCLLSSGKLIGNIYLSKQDFGTWELGYVFNADYQGNGYAAEAARAVIDDAFRSGRARRVVAMCNPLNEPSWRLLDRLGMRREGHLLKNIYFKSDEGGQPVWQDTYEYAILESEWEKSR